MRGRRWRNAWIGVAEEQSNESQRSLMPPTFCPIPTLLSALEPGLSSTCRENRIRSWKQTFPLLPSVQYTYARQQISSRLSSPLWASLSPSLPCAVRNCKWITLKSQGGPLSIREGGG